ncbi:MAG: hypothetical protein IKP48_00370 [Bacteroidaceae bacterium]|nr:hypothetical protein [Bacteroidaceae bacterium]
MKKLELHIIMLGLLTICLMSCDKDPIQTDYVKQIETLRLGGNVDVDIPVCIAFDMLQDDIVPITRASVVGGNENTPPNYITKMDMLCFTEEGIYLGHRPAELEGNEVQSTTDGHWGRKLIKGTVPARTANIHFIGNVDDSKIPGNDQVGASENLIIRSAQMTMNADDRAISYWGYHGENNYQDMSNWLSVRTPVYEEDEYGHVIYENGSPVQARDEYGNLMWIYSQNEGSIVHMVRDRAKLVFSAMDDLFNINGRDYYIKSISWILVNGMKQGYITPFNRTSSAHPFDGYYDDTTQKLVMNDQWKNPYNAGGRYNEVVEENAEGQVNEGQMMTIYENGNGTTGTIVNNPIFLFEDDNNQNNPPKIILKIVYHDQIHNKGDVTKYHTLMMLDKDNSPCKILRNHTYELKITRLPWEGLGHTNFEDAVSSVVYSNNRTVSISDKVTVVNDGRFELKIDGSSYLVFQKDEDATTHTVNFTYEPIGENTIPADKTFNAHWVSDPDEDSFAKKNLTVNFDPSTGQGSVTFELVTIGNNLQSGQIEIRDPETGMSRTINIYTIKKFSFGTPTLTKQNTSRTINGVTCDTYKLSFTIPYDYPAGLYPVTVRVASTTLNPFRCDVNGVEDNTVAIGVSMESTIAGATIDGEILTYVDANPFTTTANKWNTQEPGKPWNYWYSINLPVKPEGEQNVATTYDIYFDDVRPLRAAANQADNVGLFLKIKYFGGAESVIYQQP